MNDQILLWEGLRSLIHRAEEVFGWEEDERIAVPLFSMIESGNVDDKMLVDWIGKEQVQSNRILQERVRRFNWKNVVRSLYFLYLKKGTKQTSVKNFLQLEQLFIAY